MLKSRGKALFFINFEVVRTCKADVANDLVESPARNPCQTCMNWGTVVVLWIAGIIRVPVANPHIVDRLSHVRSGGTIFSSPLS